VTENGVSEFDSAVVSHNRFEASLMVYDEKGLLKLEMYNARIRKMLTALFLSSLSKVKPVKDIYQLGYRQLSL
jgi:hypothetical protein